jgi:polyhydroxyalkanoate synthesis regulator phasin
MNHSETGSWEGTGQMDHERQGQYDERERPGDVRQQEAADRYQRARASGSVEGERSARQALEIQTLQNQIDRLERRVTSLEDELTALKSST